MTSTIEAIHIIDEHNNPILTHTYAGRPLPASTLLPLYLEQPEPRGSLTYVSSATPPTLVFRVPAQGRLTFLLTATSDVEPLAVLEFLHRVIEALEEFLGPPPLLPQKLEANYHIVAQLLTEMCDTGLVVATEPNALRDLVEVEGWVDKLLGSIPLPAKTQGLVTTLQNASSSAAATASSALSPGSGRLTAHPTMEGMGGGMGSANSGTIVPWRRANVRHTTNELYADVVESLRVTLAPSGRPLAALASGSIVFTSKVSGALPDVLLTLSCAGGRRQIPSVMRAPAFHPCVRLARWSDCPGDLSFVPPDGRFVLAEYEVDLLPLDNNPAATTTSTIAAATDAANALKLPVNVEVKTGLGPLGAEFEVRVHVNKAFRWGNTSSSTSSSSSSSSSMSHSARNPARPGPMRITGVGGIGGGPGVAMASALNAAGTPANPSLEEVVVRVPLSPAVRTLSDVRLSRGDVLYNPGDRVLQWHLPSKELMAVAGMAVFSLKCTVVRFRGQNDDEDVDDDSDQDEEGGRTATYDDADPMGFSYAYTESYQAGDAVLSSHKADNKTGDSDNNKSANASDLAIARQIAQNKMVMPSSVSVSFTIKGWLASGIKVDGIVLDPRRSKGLPDTVKPYKGVKYVTMSQDGLEIRC